MMRLLTLILSLSLLIACSESPLPTPPSDIELENLFEKNREIFIELRDIGRIDLQNTSGISAVGNPILEIGEKGIDRSGLDHEKHQSYIEKLNNISTKRLTIYQRSISEIETEFLVFSVGLVTGGCSSRIEHLSEGEPFIRKWAVPYEVIDLKDGWYAYTLCS